MDAEAWKRVIGEEAWNRMLQGFPPVIPSKHYSNADTLARILTNAHECGFRPPESYPQITPDGCKVLWPRPDGGVAPVLTAAGLERYWTVKGHGFLLLRVSPLLRALAGPLLPWLQVILEAYERACADMGIDPLVHPWRVFVGGTVHTATGLFGEIIANCPESQPSKIQRLTIAGSTPDERK